MKPSYRFFRGCYHLAHTVISVFYRIRVTGKENIPAGGAMVCANHSSMVDPFLLAFTFGIGCHLHVIAKVELFKIPVISQVLRKMGMISVNRGISDVATIKSTFGYLKKNEKVAIFPEGTRTVKEGSISAKSGAIKLADHAGVPLVPVFLPRKKPLFSRIHIVIGEPYHIERQGKKPTADEYALLADTLMEKIRMLNPEVCS